MEEIYQSNVLKNKKELWTTDEDQLLSQTVLSHIREGRSYVSAFQEVALKIGRSKAACGFRFNSVLRSKISDELELIKNGSQGEDIPSDVLPATQKGLDFNVVIEFLKEQQEAGEHWTKEKQEIVLEVNRLYDENSELRSQLLNLQERIRVLQAAGVNIEAIVGLYHQARSV